MTFIKFLKCNIYRLLFLLILSFVLYSNSLNGEFVYDDIRTVVENSYLDSINSLYEIFTTISFWGEDRASRAYRPIATCSHLFINLIFKRNQFWFHLFNLIINTFNVALVFFLLTRFMPLKIAFAASCIFCVHPIHTEAVANITGAAELLGAMFFLTSFSLLITCKQKMSWQFMVAMIALFLGMLSKEHVVVLPVVYIIYLILFDDTDSNYLKKLILYKYHIILSFATVCLFVFIRSLVFKHIIGFGDIHFYDNFIPSQPFFYGKLSSVKVVGMYIYKFIFPRHLLADYSYPIITPVTKFMDFNLVHFSFYVLLCFSPLFLTKNKIAAFSALFFFTCISFVSNFFFQIGTIMAERLLYLPSLGLSVLLVSFLNMILKKVFTSNSVGDRFFWVIIFVLCTILGLRTVLRNKDWTTPQNLWNVTIATTDKSFRAYNNRANIFIDKKDFTNARIDLFKSLEIYKDHYTTTYSIGRTFDGENSLDSAIKYYTKSIQVKPNFYKSRINRGIDLLIQKEFEKAIKDFDVCSQLKPHEYFPWYNKAMAYFELKKYKQSKKAIEKALGIDARSEKAQILLGRIFLAEKNYLEAEKVFKALPENAETLFYLGYSKIMAGDKEESVIMLKKSIKLYPAVKKTILGAEEFSEIWHLIK